MSVRSVARRTVEMAKKVWHGFGMVCAGLFVLVFPALIIFGIIDGMKRDEQQERERQARLASVPSAAPTTRTPIDWTYEGAVCADGTLSFSIGKQGACSHHGGVAGRWTATDGTQVICRNSPPRTQEQVDQQMSRFGRIVC
ncbi:MULTISPECIES: DUF3761 domain-containing protein [unclassified Streptomyces]|uniref:DUF3761 domain-containing protein n=1 Tax=unclassified Streptomyces TaxID=2593676 RepID=UPI0016606D34|nr:MULTISPECIES: DUF3761 domain-containing protein [unclassified Streptomyces]MBD0707101.1 hypothetical protein [Streptomyces sp. CBMA291]MBD0714262.1 hypothetical protein [Streptomyces sp. CBMA370]